MPICKLHKRKPHKQTNIARVLLGHLPNCVENAKRSISFLSKVKVLLAIECNSREQLTLKAAGLSNPFSRGWRRLVLSPSRLQPLACNVGSKVCKESKVVALKIIRFNLCVVECLSVLPFIAITEPYRCYHLGIP